jgi:solute carrier family 25 S-adenosylmethionine transporter 26
MFIGEVEQLSMPCSQVDTKPASDIVAGAVARAASQGTIHPLDTLKVRMQARGGASAAIKGPLSKFGKLVPPSGACKPFTNSWGASATG